jgi:hypothetical protein
MQEILEGSRKKMEGVKEPNYNLEVPIKINAESVHQIPYKLS